MKKGTIYFLIATVFFVAYGCGQETQVVEEIVEEVKEAPEAEKRQFPNALENGKIFTKEGVKYMYGGEDSTEHFNISNSILKDENFHFGIGRERFHALITPEFITLEEADADTNVADSTRFLVLNINGDVRAYSVDLLTHHEIVNDVVDGQPVMAAYCVLADLGAIYDRTMGGEVFTFGLSGYTYHDDEVWDGLDGFVFWDRETESTWWPLIGKAVSGEMLETHLIEHDKAEWEDTNWGIIKQKYPTVKVLKSGQTMEAPKDWEKLNEVQIEAVKEAMAKNI
jgi:Protein of unknown function (DUF3179)